MYKSDIAENLKIEIDTEMNNLVKNTNLIPLEEKLTNVKSKEELESVKAQLISYSEYVNSNQRALEKPKVLRKIKEAGFVDVITISLIVVFVMGVAVGIGYMIYCFGM